ncbi:MAG TPA: hypothetical protein VEX38_08905 [Fimbriimonadaceae bacterium]|nr:hypothetical protein [Fimbriimonadaceae bacterium]
MLLPVFLLTALGQATQQPFSNPITFSEPVRLALTPRLDGTIQPGEWDALSAEGGVESYLQWQPNKVHLGAKLPQGRDLLVSLDLKGDGWLQGRDNLEIRVSFQDGVAKVSQRLLDGTRREGPAWADAAAFTASTKTAAKADESGNWTVEITLQDPGSTLVAAPTGTGMTIRFDTVEPEASFEEAFLPRSTTPVRLAMERGAGLPAGLTWKPEFQGRTVTPGESTRIRLTFSGSEDMDLKRIEMRTEGLGLNSTSSQGYPFPAFDKKNRAFVDYETKVAADADLGYRILKATITDGNGRESHVFTSYEISPLVTFDFNEPRGLTASEEPQTVKFSTYIRSNTRRRVDGIFRVEAPEGWKVDTGSGKNFVIYNARGSKRQVFSLVVPGGFKGTAPIRLVADIAGAQAEQTVWIVVP